MISAAALDALLAAGASAEAIVAAVKADVLADANAVALRRAKAAEKKRRQRAAKDIVPGTIGDGEGQGGTALLETKGFSAPLPKTQTSNLSEPKGSSRETTRVREAADFSRFWAAYPAKIAKPIAEKAFAKAFAKIPGPDPLGVLLAAVERYRQTKPPDRDWCHPATWLNQERWTDEPPSAEILTMSRQNDRTPPRQDRAERYADHLAGIGAAMAAVVE